MGGTEPGQHILEVDVTLDELADILAYVVSFAGTMGIDLSSALEEKMKKNAVKYPREKFKGKFR